MKNYGMVIGKPLLSIVKFKDDHSVTCCITIRDEMASVDREGGTPLVAKSRGEKEDEYPHSSVPLSAETNLAVNKL